MRHLLKQKNLAIIPLLFLAADLYSAQPLSEQDMDGVSAETGQNILDIFGAPAAGLEEDIEISGEDSAESSEQQAVAEKVLEDSEERNRQNTPEASQPELSFAEIEEALEAGISVIGNAKVFDTSSEIQYLEKDFHHDAEFLTDGTVIHRRDLQIDVLKLENLRGDDTDGGSTLGSIYLHDWRSRGSTQIRVDD